MLFAFKAVILMPLYTNGIFCYTKQPFHEGSLLKEEIK